MGGNLSGDCGWQVAEKWEKWEGVDGGLALSGYIGGRG